MYSFLIGIFPRPLALMILALWYTALIILIYSFSSVPTAEFRYLN